MASQKTILLIIATVLIFGYRLAAQEVQLQQPTLEAFDRYVSAAEEVMGAASERKTLRIDELPESERKERYKEIQRGNILIQQIPREHEVPSGLIHHWVGTALLPGVTLERTLAVLQSYDRYAQIYSPTVQRSKLLNRNGDDFNIFLCLRQKKVLTVTFHTEYAVHYQRLGPQEAEVRSLSTRIAEVENAGEATEREKQPGNDSGYLWRLNTYWRLRQTAQGTLAQCESISLSRAIPAGLGWLVGPFVESIPRESLRFTLEATRKALNEE